MVGRVMLYPVVLLIHSWLRWLVVGAGVFVSIRAAIARKKGQAYEPVDDLFSLAFVALLDTQVLLGLSLYLFLSPMTHAAFQNVGPAMKNSALRFFLVEHAFSMALALGFAHAARIRARKQAAPADKHRQIAVFIGISIGCVLVGIPWPFLPYARPLARLDAETVEPAAAKTTERSPSATLFQERCSPCHGPNGAGDGPIGQNLYPRPRDFRDPQWQSSTSDEAIEHIIAEGGAAMKKSPLMPANPDLDAKALREMRSYIRSLRR